MKKLFKAFVCLSLAGFMTASVSACGDRPGGRENLDYNQYSTDYDPNVNSWEQIDPDDEDLEITWFTNYTFYGSKIVDLIRERTGVNVKFQRCPIDEDSDVCFHLETSQ